MFGRKMVRLPKVSGTENSLSFRISTLITVLIGVVANLSLREETISMLGIVLATIAGFVISWKRRDKNNLFLKLIITFILILLTGRFFKELWENIYDTREPLTNLLIGLQVLHSFDLPRRHDLNFSLVIGFILIAVAGTMNPTWGFVPFLIAFLLASITSLIFKYRSELHENFLGKEAGSHSFFVIKGLIFQATWTSLLVLAISIFIFFLLPRFPGGQIRVFPCSIKIRFPISFDGRIVNRVYPFATVTDIRTRKPLQRIFNPDGYYGFNHYLDLNYRGELSSELVMRVQSTRPGYWRGLAFDQYTGWGWEMSEESVQRFWCSSPPLDLSSLPEEFPPTYTQEVVQIYRIEKEQPNVVFGMYRPKQIYFPSDSIFLDSFFGIRSPFLLSPGTIYTIISEIPTLPRGKELISSIIGSPNELQSYLQLPPLPARVKILAKKIADSESHPYYKAREIAWYLQNNYPYDLSTPSFPENIDTVDYFLFQEKRGYCEHFASAMVIMLRVVGIPSRLVTGYTTGLYNPFTGYYEVRGKDAHAWVEALIPGYGWISFDPTPGFELLGGYTREPVRWIGGEVFSYLKEKIFPLISRWRFGQLIRVREIWHHSFLSIRKKLIKLNLSTPKISFAAIAFLILMVGIFATYLIRQLVFTFGGKTSNSPRKVIQHYYYKMCRLLSLQGHPTKKESTTPLEYLQQLTSDRLAEIAIITRAYIEACYQREDPSWEQAEKVLLTWKSLKGGHFFRSKNIINKLIGKKGRSPHLG